MDPYGQRSNRLPASSEQKINFSTGTIAVLAGVLILGVGIGSAITSTTDGGQGNIASQQQLDMAVPDPEFCRQWGASAFVIDVEMYTTLNPSTSFVTQPALRKIGSEIEGLIKFLLQNGQLSYNTDCRVMNYSMGLPKTNEVL